MIGDYEALRLKRVTRALENLSDGCTNQSFPLLISMQKEIQRTLNDSLIDNRNNARMAMACAAAIRGQAHKKGKLKKRNASRVDGQTRDTWSIAVMPSKAHHRVVPTIISPIFRQKGKSEFHPGKIFSKYWGRCGIAEQ